MKIIKRNGAEETFRIEKIIVAITKANNAAEDAERLTPLQIDRIAQAVAIRCEEMNRSLSVEEIQDLVEDQIMAHGAFEVAKRYITYRYTRSLVRQSNTTDDRILSLIECNNEEVKQENANKNPTINAVQRDYMAGEVSKDIATSSRRMRPVSSTSTMRITMPSICTTATLSISRTCCRTARSSPARSSKSRIPSPRPAISPRRSSRRSPRTSMAASPSL